MLYSYTYKLSCNSVASENQKSSDDINLNETNRNYKL